MDIETDEGTFRVAEPSELKAHLARLNRENNRGILSTGDERYIQTAVYDNGFVIEKREGSEARHYHARYRGGRDRLPSLLPRPEKPSWWMRLLGFSHTSGLAEHAFSYHEMEQVFVAYFNGAPMPAFVEWVEGYSR